MLLGELAGSFLREAALRDVKALPAMLSRGDADWLAVDQLIQTDKIWDSEFKLSRSSSPGNPILCGMKLEAQVHAASPPQPESDPVEVLSPEHSVETVLGRYFATHLPSNQRVLMLEVVLREFPSDSWEVVVDIACPAHERKDKEWGREEWRRIAWWQKDGIAASNRLLSVTPFIEELPGSWVVQTPSTANALCAYVKDYFLVAGKAQAPGFWQDIKIDAKVFERGVTSLLMRAVPGDFGGLAVIPSVFLLATCCGPLQVLMWFCWIVSLCITMLRFLCLLFGVSQRVDGGLRIWSADALQKQMESWTVYFGLLGTLLYLSLAIMQLRIHPSSAVMQSIISAMSVSMSQAFLTTVVSSTLQRVSEFGREMVAVRERLAASVG
jgi:hypothetical protein